MKATRSTIHTPYTLLVSRERVYEPNRLSTHNLHTMVNKQTKHGVLADYLSHLNGNETMLLD